MAERVSPTTNAPNVRPPATVRTLRRRMRRSDANTACSTCVILPNSAGSKPLPALNRFRLTTSDGRIEDREASRLDGHRGEGDRPLGPGLCCCSLLLGMVDIARLLPVRHPGLNVGDLGLDAALQRLPVTGHGVLDGADALIQLIDGRRCRSPGLVAALRRFGIRLLGECREAILDLL